MSRFARWFWWLVFVIGAVYFFLPLVGTLAFSLRANPPGHAYTSIAGDKEFVRTLLYSTVIGLLTVVVSTALVVPTAYWVRLRLPRIRPVIEFVTLLPFMVPPVVLVFGLIVASVAGFAVWLQVVFLMWGHKPKRFKLMTLDWPEDTATVEGKERIVLEQSPGMQAPSAVAVAESMKVKPAE